MLAAKKGPMETNIERLQAKISALEQENALLKQHKVEITEAKELYLKIFEEFPALIWRSRLDKLCDYFNKTWLEFTGRTMEQEFGNGWAEGVHPDDFDACLQTYVTSFDKREAFMMEYRMKNKAGEYRWIRDFGRPFYDLDNSFIGYIGSCYDITDNKNNELNLIELNATKDKFFSIIAHDLKSPFGSIIGYCELLVEYVNEKNYEMAGEIASQMMQSSVKAMDLLTNLSKWAQSQSGHMNINPQIFDISELIQTAGNLLKGVAEQKSITIENQLREENLVYADKEMISTVVRNLISNALKFTHAGGKVSITSALKHKMLEISVTDNGVGISPDRMDMIFQITRSKSTAGTQKEKGTGLGLILCKEFVTKNHGNIWVTSAPGAGSTFTFSLPVAPKS